ncbi:pyruvate dehydrogenase (acetyl-transferring), homodimeric type [Chenggangzhangella methanolivorans]|uniref:Pyruvate dehydrogenase E1 component n=1 Tax=Chenggangzhangella methanolivorans TaxID=1437009 RepID=A0A9E6R660_9HYPH|nr:pyruvate dehydrogenase (acetyl-transferring), homodimeric type [Chenggangzhangella methanolivorans]QZN98960.1 pyruvate dehydrogenase (acetyl-transferring), homodimeric type [Chenggangzhangella methanolivorans]
MMDHDDGDALEVQDWLESLEALKERRGEGRASHIVDAVLEAARREWLYVPQSLTTPYRNTIPVAEQPQLPGDRALERKLRSIIRWNALAIILRANKESSELGGHIASFQSAATLYDIGFGHFWHAPTEGHGGDLIFVQGHSSPGIYARAFLEGRLTEEQLLNYRQETEGKGISSYPHPWLMPDFWQFPTVSMGLGPLMAIYQARFLKYLESRGFAETANRKVWAFMGDGEMDEPESMGAISLAGREKLDNLIFVINCNLQRLDGPVRGNGKIVQELESNFRGAGWNVIKVLWGTGWDALIEKDKSGMLLKRMEECVDGEYQTFKSKSGAYVREHFFGKYEETRALVADMSDDDIWKLTRGGHDSAKVFAAYAAAVKHTGQPTLILPKTVKGYGMGESGEGQMIAHQAKKMTAGALKGFRDRFQIPVSDEDLDKVPFIKLPEDAPEMQYLRAQRAALGGSLPQRRQKSEALEIPALSSFQRLLDNSGEREISTTMAFVQMLGSLVRDKQIGKRIVPIVPDESRTFGMEGMFRQLGIYSSVGQLYRPEDADQLMYYREDKQGQVLQEGINEGGAMSSWIVAATSYSTNNVPMIPFYIFYSMFGLQRVGDLAWLAGDMRARGFLLGGTAGRTTLNGEGLQHEDGHSHVFAAAIPNCISYDPTFAYEVVTIIRDGMRRMYQEQEDVYYYVTLMNENYAHPGMAEAAAGDETEEGILRGLYLLRKGERQASGKTVQLVGSGTILREVIAAAELLEKDFGVAANIWSATSFNELRRDGMAAERWNMLHPTEDRRKSWVEAKLGAHDGPVIASTDYVRNYADQIREYVTAAGKRYVVLGTDGFGRSDYRVNLRRFFEVDRHYVAVAALKALADENMLPSSVAAEAIAKYGLDQGRAAPWTV